MPADAGPMAASDGADDADDGDDAAAADRRRGLNHKPAWMSRGIGINEQIFGKTTGDLMKPGLTKADLERIENSVPEGPDPFGDVFRESGVAVSTKELAVQDEAASADVVEQGMTVEDSGDEAEPDYDPFVEEPVCDDDGYGVEEPPPLAALDSKAPPVKRPPPSPSLAKAAATSKAGSDAVLGAPGPPPGPPPGALACPPGPPDAPPSKSARTKSATAVQTSKSSAQQSKARSSALTKSAGALKRSGATAKNESAAAAAPPPAKVPAVAKSSEAFGATAMPSMAALTPPVDFLDDVAQLAPPLAPPPGPSAGDLAVPMLGPVLATLPGPMLTPGPNSLELSGSVAPEGLLDPFSAPLPGAILGAPLLAPELVPGVPNMLAPGMPLLPPLPPEMAAVAATAPLLPQPDIFNLPGLGAVPLPVSLPPAALLVDMPVAEGAEISQWETHMSPQGAPYYYCKKTGESRWVRPVGPLDVVGDVAAAVQPAAPSAPDVKTQLGEPDSWETIGRTGWLRVETENGFRYFFHKKKKITSWECPPEIAKEVEELDGALNAAPAKPEGAETEPEKAADAAPKVPEDSPEEGPPAKLSKAERVEKKEEEQQLSKEKQRLLNFKNLLLEKGVKAFDKFEKWLPKLLHDPRFTAVPGQKERKALFDALAKRIDAERKKQAAEKKRGGREVFKELLAKAESSGLFKECAVSVSQSVFKEGPVAAVQKRMEKRFSDDKRWESLPERERSKMIADAFEEFEKTRRKAQEVAKREFRELCVSALKGREDRPPKWHDVRKKLKEDKRWGPLESADEREQVYNQVVAEFQAARKKKLRRQRQDEDEVDQARKKRRLSQAEEDLLNLLAERVKQPFTLEWEDVQVKLRDNTALRKSSLNEDEQERIWKEYRKSVADARCQVLIQHLKDMPGDVIGPDMSFEAVMKKALEDRGASKVFTGLPEDLMRSSWEDWRAQAHESAAALCQHWLRSCEHFRGAEKIDPAGGPEFEALLQRLSQADLRFRRLAARPEEQRQLVKARLEELREARATGRSGMEEET